MNRKITVLIIILLLFLSLPINLYFISSGKSDLPQVSTSSEKILLSQLRGEIYDCNMKKLVNRKTENVIIALPEKENAEILKNYLNKKEYQKLQENIDLSLPYVIKKDAESDNFLSARIFNRYTDDGFLCHILGYINFGDNKGISGIEKSFDELLKEDNRSLFYTYNTTADKRMLAGGLNEIVSENYYSQKGVWLTIDYDIQRIAENAMWLYGIDTGAVVVLDSSNGEIRAMASTPKFNQNNVALSLDDVNAPFLNRALNSFSVGSVFKFVVAAAAIKEGKDDFVSFCDSSLTISEKTFACSGYAHHGVVDMKKAMAHSCNTYFIRLALELGEDKILRMAENTGFGKSFSLAEDLYVSSGNLPEKEEIMTDGDIANLAFGQGNLLATPLQIASCYSSCVNGGYFIEPRLVKGTVTADGKKNPDTRNQYKYRTFSEDEADKLKDILINNFSEGTCVTAKPENCIAGGKTSTAQTGWMNEKGEEVLHSWFAGFAEKNDKNYTIVVLKENGESGAADCGPVFKEIAERIANNH